MPLPEYYSGHVQMLCLYGMQAGRVGTWCYRPLLSCKQPLNGTYFFLDALPTQQFYNVLIMQLHVP